MKTAFILISSEPGAESEVLEALMEIPEVKEAHAVYGVYDIIARVEAETMQELKDTINHENRRLDKVGATMTLRCVEATDGG